MAGPTVMGMNLWNFIVSVMSAIGALYTIVNWIRNLVPTTNYITAVKAFIKVKKSWEEFDNQDSKLSPKQRAGFLAIFNSIDEEIRSLFFVQEATLNIVTLLRAVFKSRKIRILAKDVNKLRVAILVLSKQRAHIRHMQKIMDEGSTFVNLAPLEKRFRKMADLFIGSFGDREGPSSSTDIEANGPDGAHAIDATGMNIRPTIPIPEQSAPPTIGRRFQAPLRR